MDAVHARATDRRVQGEHLHSKTFPGHGHESKREEKHVRRVGVFFVIKKGKAIA